MDQELLVVTTAGDVLGHDADVFCIAKHSMRTLHPNSCPSLVLPMQHYYLAVPTRAPAQWEAPTPFNRDRVDRLLQLATTIEQMTEDWGPRCLYFRVAVALRELVFGHACPAVVLGCWAPLPRQLFQHSVTPAMYTLGTCLKCRGAC